MFQKIVVINVKVAGANSTTQSFFESCWVPSTQRIAHIDSDKLQKAQQDKGSCHKWERAPLGNLGVTNSQAKKIEM